MSVKDILIAVQSKIVADWFESTMKEYSGKTAAVYANSGNQFANPVGAIFSKAMEAIVGNLLSDVTNHENIKPKLDEIIRIRALQNFSPSEALKFIFRLKDILLKYLDEDLTKENIRELLNIEDAIDRLARISFDIYARCREELFELRNKEIQNQARILLKRANVEYSFNKKASFFPRN